MRIFSFTKMQLRNFTSLEEVRKNVWRGNAMKKCGMAWHVAWQLAFAIVLILFVNQDNSQEDIMPRTTLPVPVACTIAQVAAL